MLQPLAGDLAYQIECITGNALIGSLSETRARQ